MVIPEQRWVTVGVWTIGCTLEAGLINGSHPHLLQSGRKILISSCQPIGHVTYPTVHVMCSCSSAGELLAIQHYLLPLWDIPVTIFCWIGHNFSSTIASDVWLCSLSKCCESPEDRPAYCKLLQVLYEIFIFLVFYCCLHFPYSSAQISL